MSLEFHTLRISEVTSLTDDAITVTFDVPPESTEEFRFLPGQHVTLRASIDGQDVRRSYSFCSNANEGKLRVGIKRLPGGLFSNWAISTLRAGDEMEVMSPVGEFCIDPRPEGRVHRVAIAAGSGITPMISLISTTLEVEQGSSWTLLYGNRTANSVMFLEELEGLKDRYPDRFQLFHILSREGSDIPFLSGRIDAEKIETVHSRLLGGLAAEAWYLCGPFDMVTVARSTLIQMGVDPAHIHDELFFAGPPDPAVRTPEP
ncbi:MAG: FAD-binding oxidoreductase, partial [Acidimicrobiia bacterium]